ncbi:MAG TPA: hypothetical protein VLF43_00095 [Candidatus Saccharimonadales bacterium]|nr:hypothetical protein [Candidatus Saccharimonadales bacterium]
MRTPHSDQAGRRQGLAHPEDSLALAEHLLPKDLEQRLGLMSAQPNTLHGLYEQAGLYNEYALATPGYKGDDILFALSRDNLATIIASGLPSRDPLRHKAGMLFAWQIPFDLRAQEYPIPRSVAQDLQIRLGTMQAEYLDGPSLTSTEYGYLSELVAPSYILNSDHFPYITTHREEANIIRDDNHDLYTLHQCDNNRVKKAPLSIKYRWEPGPNHPSRLYVLTLTVGRLALAEALSVPAYKDCPEFKGRNKEAYALRLAADIMISYTAGDTLESEDIAFMHGLTNRFVEPIEHFAGNSRSPDYASNAAIIQHEIAARYERLKQARLLRLRATINGSKS